MATLAGQGKAQIFNALQTNMLFKGIRFANGAGSSGAG
jgi:hypothetical protein